MLDSVYTALLNSTIVWWPWISFLHDVWFLQFFIAYLLYLIFTAKNSYFTLLYLLIEIFLFGLFISFLQMELFTGFLWVLEGTIIFISILILFYLNSEGASIGINVKVSKQLYLVGILVFLVIYSFFFYINDYESIDIQFINFTLLWDDYYEALVNFNVNDFKMIFISYYKVNSVEFLCVGLLLLIGSILCINLNKFQKNSYLYKAVPLLKGFNFFKDYVDYYFLRKQDLHKQTIKKPVLRFFKKK